MNIGVLVLMIVGGSVGLLSTLYLLVSLPVVIVYKFYRKIRFQIPVMK